ncbi:MAG: hypothetical protein K9J42_12645 [Sulfuritalea sp.]|nr:hypothetical protein [Sulfuritalea sp.]
MTESLEIACIVRNACVRVALDGYEQAQISGLCQEGAWEVAVDAMRTLDLSAVVDDVKPASGVASPSNGLSPE